MTEKKKTLPNDIVMNDGKVNRVYYDHEANERNAKKMAKYYAVVFRVASGFLPTYLDWNEDGLGVGRIDNCWYVISEPLEPVRGYKVKGKIVPIKGDTKTYENMWADLNQ